METYMVGTDMMFCGWIYSIFKEVILRKRFIINIRPTTTTTTNITTITTTYYHHYHLHQQRDNILCVY
jgi:hypothetical protein